MDSSHQSQIIQIKKVFFGPLLLLITTVIVFILSYLIKSEYDEYFKYGQITNGIVTETYWESSKDSPPTSLFFCKIRAAEKNYIYSIQNADQSFVLSNEEIKLIEAIQKKDLVKIKVLSEKTAKILEWKNLTIAPINKFSNIFGVWLVILLLLTIAGALLYKVYTIYKK